MLTSEQAACQHHGDTDAWTADWHCRHCGAQWGETLVRYFRDKATAGDHPEFHTAVADELVRLDEPELAAHLEDGGDVAETWATVRKCGDACCWCATGEMPRYLRQIRDHRQRIRQRAEGAGR